MISYWVGSSRCRFSFPSHEGLGSRAQEVLVATAAGMASRISRVLRRLGLRDRSTLSSSRIGSNRQGVRMALRIPRVRFNLWLVVGRACPS